MLADSHCDGLLPRDLGLLLHCRRVAALGQAVAHHLFLTTEQKAVLHTASILHHSDASLSDGAERDVLRAFSRPGAGSSPERVLADIIRLADSYDCEYEAAAVEGTPLTELLPRLHERARDGLWPASLVDSLEQMTSQAPPGGPCDWRLPSFDASAARILTLLNNAALNLRSLEDVAGTDPCIAGKLVQLANSALFYSRRPVSTLSAAIARLGFQTARKVIAASLARPLLASPRTHVLWLHSLESADIAEQLADRTGAADPGEAYLCGLVHDIGTLVLSGLPLYDAARLYGLEEGGCPKVYAENLILRRDHAELGALVAEYWKLPAHMADAIRHHHRPERSFSPQAHLLYLAEFLTSSDEDLPSRYRLLLALDRLDLRFEDTVTLKAGAIVEWLAAA